MKRTRGRRAATAFTAACTLTGLGLATTAGVASAAPAAPASTRVLTSEVLHGLSGYRDLGAVDASTPMTIGVQMAGDTAARAAAYKALFTPGSASYHHFYTPASFEAAFGVSQAMADTVRSYSVRDGLRITY